MSGFPQFVHPEGERQGELERLREVVTACIGDAEGQEAVRENRPLMLTKGQVQLLARALCGYPTGRIPQEDVLHIDFTPGMGEP